MYPNPNYDNLPWASTTPFRMMATLTAPQIAGGFNFKGVKASFNYDLNNRSLYLIESMSFLPSVSDEILLEALVDSQTKMSLLTIVDDSGTPVFRNTLPFAGRVDDLRLRWWYYCTSEPKHLETFMSCNLDITDKLVGYQNLSIRVALNGYEVSDKNWIAAFSKSSEWIPGADASGRRGVSMVEGVPPSTLAERSF
ncbi:MAG: hypothetical protein WC906_04085 [Parcubacteria group bacterium]|jgi:hypothetical protein